MEKLKQFGKSIYVPFILLGIILIILHIPFNKFGDDLWFEKILDNQNIIEYTNQRFNTWTSRNIIELVLVSFSNSNVSMLLWKVLNVCMFELLAYSAYIIFVKNIQDKNKKLKLTWFLIMVILLIPFTALKDTGWIATTTNYLWVLSIRNVCNDSYKEKY